MSLLLSVTTVFLRELFLMLSVTTVFLRELFLMLSVTTEFLWEWASGLATKYTTSLQKTTSTYSKNN